MAEFEEKTVRKMPYDPKAEKAVIAGLIIDSQKINLVQLLLKDWLSVC